MRLLIGQALITALLARYLGPDDFGLFQFATAIVALCLPLAGLGLDELIVRDLVRYPSAEHTCVLATAQRLKLLGASLAAAVALLIAFTLRPGDGRTCLIVALLGLGLFATPWDVFDGWLQSRSQFRSAVQTRLAGFLVSACAKVGLVLASAPLWALALASAGETLIVAAAIAVVAHRQGAPLGIRSADPLRKRTLMREGAPLLASGLFVMGMMQLDKVMLGQMAGNEVAGLYAAAARITELFYAVPLALGLALAPHLARLRTQDTADFWRTARRAAWVLAGLAAAIAGVVSLFNVQIVRLFYGARFDAAARLLSVHVWSLVFIFVVSLRGRLLVIEQRTLWIAMLAAVGLVANVALNSLLIPRWGALGAAYASSGSWAISALLAPVLFPPMYPMLRDFLGTSKT